ncbi:hypothetical protein SAMN04487950_2621 [Halogranum rubrum]|uniref:Uncharacterized protein n=2 Tax=Halogranum rubrum TaxID=553466 RepID=A0A1I4F5H9_9EURY|nr:hypothetical protein SAMN04487950_2621 [Halogranum rubrum]
MVLSALDRASELGYRIVYLPALSFGYIFVESVSSSPLLKATPIIESTGFYFVSTIVLLSCAVLFHGAWRSVAGPQGASSTISEKEETQRVVHTLLNRGEVHQYPQYLIKLNRHEGIPKKRLLLGILVIFSALIVFLSYPFTVYELYVLFPARPLVTGLLLFVTVAIFLQLVTNSWWPRSHVAGAIEETEIEQMGSELIRFTHLTDIIDEPNLSYNTKDGGSVNLQFGVPDGVDIEEMIEIILVGYSGTFAGGSFPCANLEARVRIDKNEELIFNISQSWVQEYDNREITLDELVDRIVDTFEFVDAEKPSLLSVLFEKTLGEDLTKYLDYEN